MDSAVVVAEKPKRSNAGVLAAHAANEARRAAGLPVGRPKGSVNKLTLTTRKALIDVFDNLGGVDGMTKWARKHPTQFYGLLVKATPKEREANSLGTGIVINVGSAADMRPVIEVVRADHDPE